MKPFDEVCRKAADRGIRVGISELVGVLPLKAMLDAGRYFLRKQQRSTGVSDKELIKIAVKSLGLDELYPFDPKRRSSNIFSRKKLRKVRKKLVDMTLTDFADETASESPAPGGGRSLPIWGLGCRSPVRWSPTSPHTNGDGTTVGKNLAIGLKKEKYIRLN